jgi:flagellar basal-body rod protein FlgC
VFSSAVNSKLGPNGTLRVSAGTDAAAGMGVKVTQIMSDPKAVRTVHDPSNPDADANGDVLYPDIDVTTEMTDMLAANRAYEANVTVLDATKNMALKALEIGKA